jgi:choline dehydrogenase
MDSSWARNDSLPGSRILRRLTELIGQDPDKAADLINSDLLEYFDGVDEKSSVYSMVTHSDSKGMRYSPNNYIRATLADPAGYPLTVKLRTLATKVLFDPATVGADGVIPRAIGVEVMEGESLYKADPKHVPGTKGPVKQYFARREVIVSGGAFNSPQLLKLSGIGPKDELAKFNITLVKHLPGVGENLGDNYEGSILALGAAPVDTGLITVIFRTPNAPNKKRNIYAWCGAFSFEGFWPGFPTYHGPTQYSCAMVHMAPKSQAGSVKLVSADPQDKPEINFRFFEKGGDEDLAELVSGANILREAMQAAGAPVAPLVEKHPCPGGKDEKCTDAAQAEFFKLQAYSHHATSTCAIGGDDDEMAVLDSKFRVRGVAGLRVVDASAFPVVPGAFPSCPTMMLSMKAAEDILAEAKKQE